MQGLPAHLHAAAGGPLHREAGGQLEAVLCQGWARIEGAERGLLTLEKRERGGEQGFASRPP